MHNWGSLVFMGNPAKGAFFSEKCRKIVNQL